MMKQNRGFSLIEMIVVIAIIGLLSGISIANFRAGERSQRVSISGDTVATAIRNAQNDALTSKQIGNSSCSQGNAPVAYLVVFGSTSTFSVYGIDKCNTANLVETDILQLQTNFAANGLKEGSGTVSNLQIKFTTPFGSATASSDAIVNSNTFSSFSNASVTVAAPGTSITNTTNIDGLSGRIGE